MALYKVIDVSNRNNKTTATQHDTNATQDDDTKTTYSASQHKTETSNTGILVVVKPDAMHLHQTKHKTITRHTRTR
jgi:hypothetical protein